jgi:hypothetical protein
VYKAADYSFTGTVEEGSREGKEEEKEEEERKKKIKICKGTAEEEDARGGTIVLIDVGKTFKQAAIRWYQVCVYVRVYVRVCVAVRASELTQTLY